MWKRGTFAYSAQAWRGASLRVSGAWPRTSPPDHLDRLPLVVAMERSELLYFNLHGFEGEHGWYGQGHSDWGASNSPALMPDDLELADLEGAIVVAQVCWSAGSAMQTSMLDEGAAAFIGYTGEAWAAKTPRSWAGSWNLRLGPADVISQRIIQLLRRGWFVESAVAEASVWVDRTLGEADEVQDTLNRLTIKGNGAARLYSWEAKDDRSRIG